MRMFPTGKLLLIEIQLDTLQSDVSMYAHTKDVTVYWDNSTIKLERLVQR